MFNERYLYLSLDLLSISLPFIYSFYSHAPFYKKWKHLWIAILIPALFFIVWDEWFTQMGVWGFNPRYLTGIYIGSLPLEEVLFFICIPYACVFTYHALNYLIKKDYFGPYQTKITWILVAALVILGAIHYDKWYTAVTFFLLAAYLIILTVFIKPDYLGRFYFAYLFILIPFFIVNGILTGSFIEEQVVWYNPAEQIDFRMGTIPFEDTFYGMLLILMNVSILEYLQKRKIPKA
ncbi:MAG: lycopene cyclase domain-containing protein [Cyclobacteriaceae bacterium]|nr:lycopene cyclase domain-containing protein [Cyclobacteriaceae bacterium]UYN88170.1 MAG: lycopene cyclase domain-containing protein [Cyclobacteriaceae bacterium]